MLLAALTLGARHAVAQPSIHALQQAFQSPPASARPIVRWWWFGPAVTNAEISKELHQMQTAGFGGVELASVYPLALDDPSKRIHNAAYTSPEHLAAVRFAAQEARTLGLRADITLGTGWPFGGPHIPITQAAGRLKIVAVPLPAKPDSLPTLADGDTLVATFEATSDAGSYAASTARQTAWQLPSTQTIQPSGKGRRVALFFISSHTRQMVKRASAGGEGFVLDHLSRTAIDTHLQAVGEKLLSAFAPQHPTAIFSDSLEVYGSDWTLNFPAEFEKRRGYSITPYLPQLAAGEGPGADAVRHDWGVTLSDLVRENYLQPLTAFAHAHGTLFRSQTYGEPAATLAEVRTADLPEGEGPQWDSFSFTRWTSSANHIFGRNITSAETWTWLHSPAFRATPLDMKAEADRMFLEGVNQIVGHGWPYSAPSATEPGWSLYAAAVFNAHNPWFPVMPAVTRYLTRTSFMLRQGAPANDVAILLPEDDAQSGFRPGHVSVTEEMKRRITPGLMRSILNAGYNVDYTSPTAIALRGLKHPVLVVPPTHSLPLTTLQSIASYAQHGGKVIFLGETPSVAPGFEHRQDSAAVLAATTELLKHTQHVDREDALPAALHQALPPDMPITPGVGFIHRHASTFDIYFVANTTNEPQTTSVAPRTHRTFAAWWTPESGAATTANTADAITLQPYESRILVLTDKPQATTAGTVLSNEETATITLSDWKATFPGSPSSPASPTHAVTSTVWTDDHATAHYSGEVRYQTTATLTAPAHGTRTVLRFGPSKTLENTQPANKPGMRALLDPPIREAAIVVVNGKTAGTLWHPPYALDVTPLIHGGSNTIEVRVFNTAINALSGQPPRDYTALKARYGDRFQMQDMDNLTPPTSGIVGPVTLGVFAAKGKPRSASEQKQ